MGANSDAPLALELRQNDLTEQPMAAISGLEPDPAITVEHTGFWRSVASDGLDEGLNRRPMLEIDAEAA